MTSFNLGNTRYSVHASVCLWIDRALESSDYGLARTLLDTAFQKNIFAAVPDFTPLTIDSLMVPDNEPIQEAFSDYEVARHPDIRAHRLLALVQAGTGSDSNSITETLAALESEFPALGLRIEVARMLVAEARMAEALNILSGGLGGIPDSVPQENYSGLKEAVLFYADLSEKLGDPRPAFRFIEEARRFLPNDADLRRKEETLRGMLP